MLIAIAPGEVNPSNLDVVVYSFFITPINKKVVLFFTTIILIILMLFIEFIKKYTTNREIIVVACHIHTYIHIYTCNALIENECISEKSS